MTSKIAEPQKPPVRRRKEARPSEIVAAGIEEFAEHGFERARLDRIAARAGIAKGTIYLYFPSKEALFAAATEEHVIQLMKVTEADLMSFEGPTAELIDRLLRRIYERVVTPANQALIRILVSEGQRVPELSAKYHEMAFKRGEVILNAIIERGVQRGEIDESAMSRNPLLILAPTLFVAIHNLIFSEVGSMNIDEFYEGHLEMVVRGLGLNT